MQYKRGDTEVKYYDFDVSPRRFSTTFVGRVRKIAKSDY